MRSMVSNIVDDKRPETDEIQRLTEEFLRKGGKIRSEAMRPEDAKPWEGTAIEAELNLRPAGYFAMRYCNGNYGLYSDMKADNKFPEPYYYAGKVRWHTKEVADWVKKKRGVK